MRNSERGCTSRHPIAWQLGEWLQGLAFDPGGRCSPAARPALREREPATLAFVARSALATIVAMPLGLVTGAYPRGWLASGRRSRSRWWRVRRVTALVLLWLALSTRWLSVGPQSGCAARALLPLAAMIETASIARHRGRHGGARSLAAAARCARRLLWVRRAVAPARAHLRHRHWQRVQRLACGGGRVVARPRPIMYGSRHA